jgi:hypothetical protein
MSDYKLENRELVVQALLERVISEAPVREILRVYQEACTSAIANLGDADVVRSIQAAGFTQIIEAFSLEIPPAPEPTEAPAE